MNFSYDGVYKSEHLAFCESRSVLRRGANEVELEDRAYKRFIRHRRTVMLLGFDWLTQKNWRKS